MTSEEWPRCGTCDRHHDPEYMCPIVATALGHKDEELTPREELPKDVTPNTPQGAYPDNSWPRCGTCDRSHDPDYMCPMLW